jgi:hypothetical protein
VPGRFGNGIALDRVDDFLQVPFDESIDLAGNDFTVMTWFRYSATTGAHALLWGLPVGTGTTPQLWLRAEPASNRIRARALTPAEMDLIRRQNLPIGGPLGLRLEVESVIT